MSSDWAPVFFVLVLAMAALSVAVLVWPRSRGPTRSASAASTRPPRTIDGGRYVFAVVAALVLSLALTLLIARLAPESPRGLALAFHVFLPAWVTLTCLLPLAVLRRRKA